METYSNKPRICVVDDELTNAQLLKMMLEDEYDVVLAHSGKDALRVISETTPDLVLLDIILPDASGYDICKKLKSDAALGSIPVIFVTGLDASHNEELGLELGAADYVTKPITAPVVKARIKRALETDMYIEYLEKSLANKNQKLSDIRETGAA